MNSLAIPRALRGEIVSFPTPEGRTIHLAPNVAHLRHDAEWDKLADAIGSHLVTLAAEPFGEWSVLTGDPYKFNEPAGHAVNRLPDEINALFGVKAVVKTTLRDDQRRECSEEAREIAKRRAPLLGQLSLMHDLASLQQAAFPGGIEGILEFNTPFAGIVGRNPRNQAFFSEWVDGTPLPDVDSEIWGEPTNVYFSATDHPELAQLVYKHTHITPDGLGAVDLREAGLGGAIAVLLSRITGRQRSWFAERLVDMRANNVLQRTLPDGSRFYTIIDMQINKPVEAQTPAHGTLSTAPNKVLT